MVREGMDGGGGGARTGPPTRTITPILGTFCSRDLCGPQEGALLRREQLPPRGQPGRPRIAGAGGAEEHGLGVVELRGGPDPLHADANRHALRGEVLRVRDGDEVLHSRAVHGVEDGPRGLGDIAVPAVLGHLPPADLQHRRLSPARGRNRLDHNEPDGGPLHRPPVVVGAAQLDETEALNGMVRQAHEVLQVLARRGLVRRDRGGDEADEVGIGVQPPHEVEVVGGEGPQAQSFGEQRNHKDYYTQNVRVTFAVLSNDSYLISEGYSIDRVLDCQSTNQPHHSVFQ